MPASYRSRFGDMPKNRYSAESMLTIISLKNGTVMGEARRTAEEAADWLRGWSGRPGEEKHVVYDH